jgi:chromosome segregation ATPase
MSQAEELDKIERALKDAELKIKSVEANLEKLDNEVETLTPLKSELHKNIEFHKKDGIIPLAHEYRKTRSELSKTTARLILLNSERSKTAEALRTIQEVIEKLKSEQVKVLNAYETNVLSVIFGGRRRKKPRE